MQSVRFQGIKNITTRNKRISIADLVMGDAMIVEEGVSAPADGIILQAKDFSVTSRLTIAHITAASKHTQLGKVG